MSDKKQWWRVEEGNGPGRLISEIPIKLEWDWNSPESLGTEFTFWRGSRRYICCSPFGHIWQDNKCVFCEWEK